MIAMVTSDCIDPCDISKVKRYILDLEKENAELKEKIKKMKNVGNCNKSMKCSKWVEQHIQGNKVTCCCDCVEWESAE